MKILKAYIQVEQLNCYYKDHHHHHTAILFCLYHTNHTEFPIDQLTAQFFIWSFLFHLPRARMDILTLGQGLW